MKKQIFGVWLIFFLQFVFIKSNGQGSDTIAQKIVEKHLKIVEDYLKDNKSDPSLYRIESIAFLDKLTDIPSSSTGNYIGQYSPSEFDLTLWKNWYKRNKENITWDDKLKKIRVTKEIAPPK